MSRKDPFVRDLPSYRKQGSTRRLLRTVVFLFISLFLVVSFVEGFFLRPIKTQSVSMEPTIQPGDIVMTSPLKYGKASLFSNGTWLDFTGPSRGDLVLLEPPYHVEFTFVERVSDLFIQFFTLGLLHFSRGGDTERAWENSPIVRRVIALPGDKVYMSNGIFHVQRENTDSFVDEFIASGRTYEIRKGGASVSTGDLVFSEQSPLVEVGPGKIFVAADDRVIGLDSRHWGLIGNERLRGEVLFRYWPFSDFGTLR